MANADIELLFGVLGGGSISSGSGKQIKDDLDTIVNSINKNPLEVKVELSKQSIADFTSELQKLTQTAKAEAASIQAAYKNIIFPQMPTQSGNGGRSTDTVLKLDTTQYYRALTKAESQLSNLTGKLQKWDAASSGTGSLFYAQLEAQGKAIKDLIKDLGSGSMKLSEFNRRISEIASNVGTASRSIKELGVDHKAVAILTTSCEDYKRALTDVNKVIATLKDNQVNWTAAKDGVAKTEFTQLGVLESEALSLKQSLETGTVSASDFKDKLDRIVVSAGATASAIRLVGENVSAGKEMETYQRQLEKVSTALARVKKSLSDWTKAKTGRTSQDYHALEIEAGVLETLQKQLVTTGRALSDFDGVYKKSVANISTHSSAIKVAGENTKTLSERFGDLFSKFNSWYSVSHLFMQIVQLTKQMVNNVVELDGAMTELKKVTDETSATYARFLDNASTRAKNLGATLTDVVSATADFSRLGYGLEDASTLADVALLYKNIGDGLNGIDDATQSLVSTMQAFGHEVKNAESIVDIFNAVSNTEAITSGGLGVALQKSASAMAAANNTLEETVALISAANTVVQNPDSVGTTLRSISMFLRASKTEAEAAGEDVSTMASSVSELRSEILKLTGNKVDIQIDENSFKSTYQILRELSQVWGELTDVSQANILELIAGKRNSNVATALIEGFEVAERALATASDSAGSAIAENEKYLDSIAGRVSQLQASWESLSSTAINSNWIKYAITGLTWLLNLVGGLVDQFGLLGIAATGVSLTAFIKNLD